MGSTCLVIVGIHVYTLQYHCVNLLEFKLLSMKSNICIGIQSTTAGARWLSVPNMSFSLSPTCSSWILFQTAQARNQGDLGKIICAYSIGIPSRKPKRPALLRLTRVRRGLSTSSLLRLQMSGLGATSKSTACVQGMFPRTVLSRITRR